MKFKTLIDKYSWKEVKPQFLKLYSEETEDLFKYKEVFNQLKNLDIKADNSKMRILIQQSFDENEDLYFDVSGINPDNSEKYGLAETKWGIWLKMELDADSLSQYGEIECLIHCLWEMTFNSFDNL